MKQFRKGLKEEMFLVEKMIGIGMPPLRIESQTNMFNAINKVNYNMYNTFRAHTSSDRIQFFVNIIAFQYRCRI